LIPFLFFTVMTFCRKEPLTLFLVYTFCLFSIGVIAVTYTGGRWFKYNLLDYGKNSFLLIASILYRPIVFFFCLEKEDVDKDHKSSSVPITAIIRGILIALPILAIFTWLLASADLVFQQKISNLQNENLFIRACIILLGSYFLMGAFLHAAKKSRDSKVIGEGKPLIGSILGFTESAIVMSSVILLFLTFVCIQFQYFFGGYTNIGVEGFTYSEYARRGFNELIIVAIFNLIMIIGLSIITKRKNQSQRRIFSGLSIAIVTQVLVMLVSAFMRLELAIDWHGFSRLRLYPQIFMIWLGVLLVAVVVLEGVRQERYFTLSIVLACIGFSATLSIINVDATIVHHNAQRTVSGKHFNVTHLANLSLDAVPALAEEFQDETYSKEIHEGIGAALVCHWHSQAYAKSLSTEWRSFNLYEWRAGQAITENATELRKYKVNIENTLIRVQSPSGEWYECNGGGGG
jgi:hypothetical protein